ncbi:MAG: hypothetical protein HIU88_12710 [Acidobacteria bacterium]|nr:hypothetical protein [Acidobacteriota bacterium]
MREAVPDPVLQTRSRIGVLVRTGADPAQLTEARRNHAAAKLKRYVERTLANYPQLTAEQREDVICALSQVGAAED